jgi:hypothetical protein
MRFQTRLQDRPVEVEVEMPWAFGCAGCGKVRSLRDASGLLEERRNGVLGLAK